MRARARVVTWQRVAAVELETADTRVRVVPELGMLVAAFEVDGFDHVARPGGLRAVRAGHTTAMPLLHPWANRLGRRSYFAAGADVSLRGVPLHADGNGLPIHGTMVGRPGWEIVGLRGGRVTATYDVGAHPELLASFPFPHTVTVDVRVARRRLRVDTTVRSTRTTAVPISFGWHPYWRVPGARDDWSVTLPAVAHARLDRRGLPTGRARAEGAADLALRGRSLDDLYALSGDRRVTLHGDRRLRLDLDDGYPFLQVYAPPDGSFCCLEPMTAPTNALVTGDHPTIRPGASFTASFSATVR
ncbi:MAG: aldose 1-epimerase [Acidimicrobiia bacterium]